MGETAKGPQTEFDGRQALERWIDSNEIDPDDVCMIGSMSMSIRGIRRHHDIDLIVSETVRDTVSEQSLPDGIGITDGRYEPVGLSDEEVLFDARYHDVVDGLKVVRPELTLAFKRYRLFPKDADDIELLEQYREETEDWNADIVPETGAGASIVSRGVQSLRNDGLAVTGIKTAGYLQRRYPPIAKLRETIPTTQCAMLASRFSGRNESWTPQEVLTAQYNGLEFDRMDMITCYHLLTGGSTSQVEHVVEFLLSPKERQLVADFRSKARKITDDTVVSLNHNQSIINPVEAAALLREDPLDVPVGVKLRPTSSRPISSLEQRECPRDEITTLRRRRDELFERFGLYFYAMLWPPSQSLHSEIETALDAQPTINVVDSNQYDVDDLSTFVHAIYDAQAKDTSREKIDEKIERMNAFNPTVRVLTIELPNPKIRDGISLEMETIKNDIRNEFIANLSEEYYYSILHVTDNYADNRRTQDVLETTF